MRSAKRLPFVLSLTIPVVGQAIIPPIINSCLDERSPPGVFVTVGVASTFTRVDQRRDQQGPEVPAMRELPHGPSSCPK
jgi:hypothetical protein